MAIDASKIRRRLPAPPSAEEGAAGIETPLPANPESDTAPVQTPSPTPAAVQEPSLAPTAAPMLDGRSLRATGRTMQLNIKVTPSTKAEILRLAQERGQLVAEVIEDAVTALVHKKIAGS